MTIRSPNTAFEIAIDPAAVEPYVRASLGETYKASAFSVYVSRVFPMNADELCVQYVVEYPGPNGTRGRSLRGACLSFSGSIPDRYRVRNGRVVTVPEIGLTIPVFPFDPALPQLESLCNPRTAWPRLSQWLGRGGNEPSQISRTVQAYRLERRCVLRFDVRDEDDVQTRVFLKLARPRKLRRAAKAFEALRMRGFGSVGPHVVPNFSHVEGDGVAFMNEVAGTSLHDLIGAEALPDALESAARVLSTLHSANSLKGVDVHTPEHEVEKLRSWARLLQRISPKLSPQGR